MSDDRHGRGTRAAGGRRPAAVAAALAVAACAIAVVCAATKPWQALAAQHPPSSLFTSIGLDTCKAQASAEGRSWSCGALLPVFVAERDSHFFLAVGSNAHEHRAARQTLQAINTPVEHTSHRITVEWRVKSRGGVRTPYASIIRYFTQRSGKPGEVLVVTKITDGQSCHVAYVDALANAEAIVLAREAADEHVPAFDCAAGEPKWIGSVGKS